MTIMPDCQTVKHSAESPYRHLMKAYVVTVVQVWACVTAKKTKKEKNEWRLQKLKCQQ